MSRPRTTAIHRYRLATFAVAIGLMLAPWIATLFGVGASSVENRAPSPFPELSAGALGTPSTFGAITEYVEDRTPLRREAAEALGEFAIATGWSMNPGVFFGPDDHLILAEDFELSCDADAPLDELTDALRTWDRAAAESGREWLLLVAPDKGAVLTSLLDGRAARAAECGDRHRATLRQHLAQSGGVLDLWGPLTDRPDADISASYYAHDSHWTFTTGSLVAEHLVDRFAPGVWTPHSVQPDDWQLVLLGDVAARVGVDRAVPVETLHAVRTGVTTTRTQEDVGGTRPVRSYRSVGSGSLVTGRTVVIHDSMMNFAEGQLAPFFAAIDFIHWDDLEAADAMDRIRHADRVVLEIVERSLYPALRDRLLVEPFVKDFEVALRAPSNP